MRLTKTLAFGTLALLPAAGLALASLALGNKPANPVARGKFLVGLAGCSDCHTPMKLGPQGPEPDMSRYLSGHPENANFPPPPKLTGPWVAATGFTAWAGPWGISYAANLTPDMNTGMGIWTEEIFINAMRTGKHFGVARDILPPMPWRALANLDDADLRAMYAYLRSIPAVRNQVPQPALPSASVAFE